MSDAVAQDAVPQDATAQDATAQDATAQDAVPQEIPEVHEPTSPATMALVLGAVFLVTVIALVAINFAFLRHWVGVHTGAQSTLSGPWYNFWSGFGSDLGEATLVTAVTAGVWTGLRKSNCHVKGCWRIGHFPLEHTPYHLCHKHHPGVSDAPTHAEILAAHRHAKADYEARNPQHDGVTAPPS